MIAFISLAVAMALTAALFIAVPLGHAPSGHAVSSRWPTWRPFLIATVGVFVATASLYAVVGRFDVLSRAPVSTPANAADANPVANDLNEAAAESSNPTTSAQPTPEQIEGMVQRLAQRLQAQPNDPPGWRMLARSYETLGRFDLAVAAYKRLLSLQTPDADLLTDYAVALGMSLDHTLVGAPEAVIDQALKLDPHHIQALALSGSAAFERRDHARAVAQWKTLLSLIPPDAAMRETIERNIDKAAALAEKDRRVGAVRARP